ncbi:MAG TPA: RodZ domain-containing protein [Vicinamibacterales bacterium]|nr:RodZ domain-containing protein [Vicinamibacterales bacterium]
MARAGERFRAAREARGLSLRQVADVTKIPLAVLEAIERGELERLPGGIFGRGFIRAYAAAVGLDPEATLRECFAACPALAAAPAAIDVEADSEFESRRRAAAVAAWLLAISLPAAVAIVYFTVREPRSAPPFAVETVATPSEPRDASPAARNEPAVAAVGVAAGAGEPPVDRRGAMVISPPVQASTSGAAAPAPIAIEVAPTGPCWVQLTLDGREQAARIVDPGERARYEFTESALVILGDAARCALRLDGRPVRALGRPGEVRRVRITRDTYLGLVQ